MCEGGGPPVSACRGAQASTSTGRDPSPRWMVRVARGAAILRRVSKGGAPLQVRVEGLKQQHWTAVLWAHLFCEASGTCYKQAFFAFSLYICQSVQAFGVFIVRYNSIPGYRNNLCGSASVFLSTHWWSPHPAVKQTTSQNLWPRINSALIDQSKPHEARTQKTARSAV